LFGFFIIRILYTGCAKIKKNNSGAKGFIKLPCCTKFACQIFSQAVYIYEQIESGLKSVSVCCHSVGIFVSLILLHNCANNQHFICINNGVRFEAVVRDEVCGLNIFNFIQNCLILL